MAEGGSDRRAVRFGVLLVAATFVLVTLPGRAAIKAWSGEIRYVTATAIYGLSGVWLASLQPYDPSSPLNDVTSSSRNVSAYGDGHYRVKVRTDAVPSAIDPLVMAATVHLADGTVPNDDFPAPFGAAQNWSVTFCLPKGAHYLRVGPYAYAGFQENVGWTIEVLDRTC